MPVSENLSDEEAYLYAIFQDQSGLDLAEFAWYEADLDDGCFRAWPFQWKWWRDDSPLQIDQCARSIGKTLGIQARAFVFPYRFPGQEMVVTAPELVHLEPITGLIERRFYDTRLGREIMPHGRSAVTHRPFQMNFLTGSRIIGRIPQLSGKGVKGCVGAGTPILTDKGYVLVEDLNAGDRVLTHEGQWKPIQAIQTDTNDCYEVVGQSSFPLTVSCDHRFYGAENEAGPKEKRRFLPLSWHDVEDLVDHKVYWASPTTFPELPIPRLLADHDAGLPLTDCKAFWWVIGRWLADGYLSMDRKNNKGRRVHWVVHPEKAKALISFCRDFGLRSQDGRIPKVRVVERDHSSAPMIEVASASLYRWLDEHFGQHADGKRLPAFVLGAPAGVRGPLLDGYLAGDGWFNASKKRWEVGTASKTLAMGMQMLAQSLGYTVNCSVVQPKPNAMCAAPKPSWRLQIGYGHPVLLDDHLVAKVKSVTAVGRQTIYNPIVEDDHSYVTGSIVSHNVHPVSLELDEAQDYPDDGWTELIETLKRGTEGATWHAHGVTRGIRDKFYEFTQESPDNHWKIHRITAIHRPGWTDEERQEKIRMYGSRDAPDYRRNVLGQHGDQTNPLFVLHRLMRCVDSIEASAYNTDEYSMFSIKAEVLEEMAGPSQEEQAMSMIQLLDFPEIHHKYTNFWVGMDVGFTTDPSEILVFAEYTPSVAEIRLDEAAKRATPEKGQTRLKLVTRVNLQRISNPLQARAIEWIIGFYRPKAFGMDKTGNGLGLFQDLQGTSLELAKVVKGYNFSEKVIVEIDGTVTIGDREDVLTEAAIRSNVLERSTDVLRELVDHARLMLPWDRDLVREFQGQTWSYSKAAMDSYGRRRRIFSGGHFHALDAARMAVFAHAQFAIEAFIEDTRHHQAEAVLDYFIGV